MDSVFFAQCNMQISSYQSMTLHGLMGTGVVSLQLSKLIFNMSGKRLVTEYDCLLITSPIV